MSASGVTPSTKGPDCQEPLSSGKVVEVVFESVVGAFVKAILVNVLGSVAVDIVGGLWRRMLPSLPPVVAEMPEPGHGLAGGLNVWWSLLHEHRFALIYGLILALTLWRRLAPHAGEQEGAATTRVGKIGQKLSEDWFNLIVFNAFGALIATIVLGIVQQFSVTQMFYRWLLAPVLALLQDLAGHLLGTGRAERIHAWFSWYGANQFKFTFWLLYLASICDDLGIPNLKTFGRWSWRRFRRRERRRREEGERRVQAGPGPGEASK